MLIVVAAVVLLVQKSGWVQPRFEGARDVALAFPLCSAPGYSPNCVVDGDTLRMAERRIRLTGFDAPEMKGACPAESEAAR